MSYILFATPGLQQSTSSWCLVKLWFLRFPLNAGDRTHVDILLTTAVEIVWRPV